ncbi:patatin-like phospholipase family protein [bacterium]|nr:patatin-like phospholipase family protein [bacterium]
MKEEKKYFCIFGGGGIRGTAYVGAVQALSELGIEIDGCAGSSVGAVFAGLWTVGYTTEELRELFYKTNFDIFRDINIDILKVFAITKGDYFQNWIKDLIEKKFYGEKYVEGKNPPVRFCDIDKKLVILSVNLSDSTYHEFSKECTPEVELAYAIRASVSIPGFFKPVEYNGKYLVDGDLIKSWPLWRISENLCPKNRKILEFRLEDNEKSAKIDSGISYINSVYNTITGFATDFIVDLYGMRDKFDYIKINSTGIGVLDFMISKEQRSNLIENGYKTTLGYFKYEYPKKRQIIDKHYDNLQKYFKEIEKHISKKYYKAAKNKLFETFVYLCEYKKYIDLAYFEEIVDFKNLFIKSYSEKNGFFGAKYSLENQEALSEKLSNLINKIS